MIAGQDYTGSPRSSTRFLLGRLFKRAEMEAALDADRIEFRLSQVVSISRSTQGIYD